ncbi:tetratricopeptide repeat protein [Bacteroidota bacterium]
MTRQLIIFISILFLLIPQIKAETAVEKFDEANKLYKNGKFPEAVSYYEELVHKGYISSELYYNLGNSYFKLDKISDAILYYERAKRISPDDDDINFNLKIANLKIVDKIGSVPKLFFIEWYESLHGMFSSETWSYFIIIFSWLTFAFLTGYFIIWSINLRKVFFFAAVASIIITLASLVFSIEQNNIEQARDEAIIFTPSVYIKSSPDKESTDLFILHEGAKVKILDQVGKWKKIRIADGNVGWLPINTIEII